ncbi:MAG: transposase [Paracoccaceae bacterium]
MHWAALAGAQEANRRLEDILRTSQRAQFAKSSEKRSPGQFNLVLASPSFCSITPPARGRNIR